MKGEVIVGLNSDTSIKRLKGEDRPVNTQADRKYLLECLRSVDRVVIFEEDTPEKLIKKINPDLIIKGGDWGKDEVAEIVNADPDKIVIWKYIKGVSTTNTISTIKSC
jgi:rfaE bifunctional protein nucleotidyltransferase chain/domain